LAFARASVLCRARFGDLVAEVLVDDQARPQGFERALLRTDDPANLKFAIVVGDDPAFRRMIPEPSSDIHFLSSADLYACWRPGPEPVFCVFDRASGRGVTWYPVATAPAWALGQPCEPLIHAAIEPTDWCIGHAAAVGRDGQFLLLAGPGKAGKTTATLACVRAGWEYAGDDVVLLNPVERRVAPLFSSARLRQSGAHAFQPYADGAFLVSEEDGTPRYELRLQIAPTGGEVVAVLGLRRRGATAVTIEPARAADYMMPLLRDSTIRAPGCGASMTRKLLAAGRMAPAFLVDTGVEPACIPDGLETFLRTVS